MPTIPDACPPQPLLDPDETLAHQVILARFEQTCRDLVDQIPDPGERCRLEADLARARGRVEETLAAYAAQVRQARQQLREGARLQADQAAQRRVRQQLRDAIWRMSDPAAMGRLLHILHEGLDRLGIDHHGIAIHRLEEPAAGHRVTHCYVWPPAPGGPAESVDPEEDRITRDTVTRGAIVYRPDLEASDARGELQYLRRRWRAPVRSVLDVPFRGGTLAINSLQVDAFDEDGRRFLADVAAILEEGFQRVADLEALEARRREAEELARQRERAFEREAALGRIRDLILRMRHLRDMPPQHCWVEELRRLGLPIGGVSLQLPGRSPGCFVTYLFAQSESAERRLDDCPWVAQAWSTGRHVLVQHEEIEGSHLRGAGISCILEVPLPGEGSLAVNRTDGGAFTARMIEEVTAFAGVVAEGLQRVRDFERLERSQERYRSLVEDLPVGVAHSTPAGSVLYANPYVRALFGYDEQEWSQLRVQDLFVNAEDYRHLASALRQQGVTTFEYAMRRKDGEPIWVRGTSRLLRHPVTGAEEYHGVLEDVTERRRLEDEYRHLEDQLRQAQRMEAVGQLTAGIAHNFNNMLQGISGNLQLALLDAPESLRMMLRDADRVTHRAAQMVKQLMVFSRQGSRGEMTLQRLAPIVRGALDICRRSFDRRILLEEEIPADLELLGDAALLQQAILNLLINARDAIEEGGTQDTPAIRLRAQLQEITPGPSTVGRRRPGRFACLEVTDNGIGMDENVRRRVFEPFFSTKAVDRGTGLGLATVYGIISQHAGWVECDSTPGQGTCFRVFLPVEAPAAAAPAERAAAPSSPQGESRGTLLIIDDEDIVRDSTARLLERTGYRMLTAASGERGLQVYDESRGQIDLVLLDLSMPAMSGHEVLLRLRRVDPDVKVLILTGYAVGAVHIDAAVLRKPFTIAELEAKVEALLN